MFIRPNFTNDAKSFDFIFRVRIRVCEQDRNGKTSCVTKHFSGLFDRTEINGCVYCAICQCSLWNFKTLRARHHRIKIPTKPPCTRAIAAAHFKNVAQALRTYHTDLGPLAFQQGICACRSAMHNYSNLRQIRYALLDAIQKTTRLIRTCRGHFGNLCCAVCFIQNEDISKGATNIDTNHFTVHDCASRHALP